MAMPMQSGIATRKTTIDAAKSRTTQPFDFSVALAKGAPGATAVLIRPPPQSETSCQTLARGKSDRQRYAFADRLELARLAVEGEDLTFMNIDEPAVKRDFAARDARRDRRMRAQMRDLRNNVFQRDGMHPIERVEFVIAAADDAFRGRRVTQPRRDIGHAGKRLRIADRLHRAAIRMAAHDDVAHAEDHHGEFDRRGHAAIGL
jgi:hypothetical protein